MTEKKLGAGWSHPPNSRKWHYWPEDDIISLCRKWMFAGERTPDEECFAGDPVECAQCRRKLTKLKAA